MSYGEVPTFAGGTLRVRFAGGPALRSVDELEFELRCVEFRMVDKRTRKQKSHYESLEAFRIYHDLRTGSTDGQAGCEVEFDLPSDVPGTRIFRPGGRYGIEWQLRVSADMRGVDFSEVYPAPIYERV